MPDLTPAELEALTGQRKPEKQAARLVALGIPFRAAGRMLFVAREVAQHWPQWQARQTGVRLCATVKDSLTDHMRVTCCCPC